MSDVFAAEFERLGAHLHFTENLTDRIARVRFSIDAYLLIDGPIDKAKLSKTHPNLDWPGGLSAEEEAAEWRCHDFWMSWINQVPRRKFVP